VTRAELLNLDTLKEIQMEALELKIFKTSELGSNMDLVITKKFIRGDSINIRIFQIKWSGPRGGRI
jgi:hypothetical protein